MQQVTHRKMSFNYKLKNHHHNSLILQEKLRESEWKRSKLEIEFNELVQQSKLNQESDLMGYKRRYRDLLESEKYRIRRNEQLFAALKRLEMRISFLSETTERYKALRSKYRAFTNKAQRGRVVGFHSRPNEDFQQDRFHQNAPINNSQFSSVENLIHPGNFRNSASGYLGGYSDKEDGKPLTFPPQFFQKGEEVQNKSPLMNRENFQTKAKVPDYAEKSDQVHSVDLRTRGISFETPIDETLPKPRTYTNGNEDGFGRGEIEYSVDIRHRMANNSNDLSLDEPKYEFVDISKSDINKYAIANPDAPSMPIVLANQDTITTKNGDLSMPEAILKKYTNDEFKQEATKNYLEQGLQDLRFDQTHEKSLKKRDDRKNVLPQTEVVANDNYLEKSQENLTPDFVKDEEKPVETKEEIVVEDGNSEAPHVVPDTNIDKGKAVPNKGETEIIETQNVDSLKEIESITESTESGIIQHQISLREEKDGPNHEMMDEARENNFQVINKATEEVIEDLEYCVSNVDQQKNPVNDSRRSEDFNQKFEENGIQPDNGTVQDIPEIIDENAALIENMSQLNITNNIPVPQELEDPILTPEREDFEPNSDLPNDQDVSGARQEETSEQNIPDSNQNSQQETTLSNQLEEHESVEDSEMKRFKKQNAKTSQPEQSQYYDQNNQNYTVDEHGQHYDMSGQPISYDPGMPSGVQPYGQEYGGQYNEKGELVAGYDQNGQAYDQQYYQNDPNYDQQYAQQYEDQQQYGEYDQEGYDPSQQGYDGSAQHGYDPNSHYNAYYAEVKYDQDPFYRGDTQEPVSNPQHEENEEADKANRLMHMLESDTENSSRQEHKVTTESDFDFSNNQ